MTAETWFVKDQRALSLISQGDLHSMNNRTMLSTLKNDAAAGYQGPVKIELLKGEGLLYLTIETNTD